MSADNGVPEAPAESDPDEIAAVISIKAAVQELADDDSLSLLERLHALEALREFIYVGIDLLDDAIAAD